MFRRKEVLKIHNEEKRNNLGLERKIKYSDPREIELNLYLEGMFTNYFVNAIKWIVEYLQRSCSQIITCNYSRNSLSQTLVSTWP